MKSITCSWRGCRVELSRHNTPSQAKFMFGILYARPSLKDVKIVDTDYFLNDKNSIIE